MHYTLTISLLFFFVGFQINACSKTTSPNQGNKDVTMNNQILSIKVKCRDNEKCLYDGKEMPIDIFITNEQKFPVGFPLEFAKDGGPSVKLVDIKTKAETYLATHPADHDLKNEFTFIPPGSSVKMGWVIFSDEIERFNNTEIDLLVEVTIAEELKINDKLVEFVGVGTTRIIGKRKK